MGCQPDLIRFLRAAVQDELIAGHVAGCIVAPFQRAVFRGFVATVNPGRKDRKIIRAVLQNLAAVFVFQPHMQLVINPADAGQQDVFPAQGNLQAVCRIQDFHSFRLSLIGKIAFRDNPFLFFRVFLHVLIQGLCLFPGKPDILQAEGNLPVIRLNRSLILCIAVIINPVVCYILIKSENRTVYFVIRNCMDIPICTHFYQVIFISSLQILNGIHNPGFVTLHLGGFHGHTDSLFFDAEADREQIIRKGYSTGYLHQGVKVFRRFNFRADHAQWQINGPVTLHNVFKHRTMGNQRYFPVIVRSAVQDLLKLAHGNPRFAALCQHRVIHAGFRFRGMDIIAADPDIATAVIRYSVLDEGLARILNPHMQLVINPADAGQQQVIPAQGDIQFLIRIQDFMLFTERL